MNEIDYFKRYKSKIASNQGRLDKLGNPIEFKLSFEQYCELWQSFGRNPGYPYVISRINDIGHYEIGNVFIQHTIGNLCDAHGLESDLDKRITAYAIEKNYKRRIVKQMIKQGKLEL